MIQLHEVITPYGAEHMLDYERLHTTPGIDPVLAAVAETTKRLP